jgi:hypothetical protein
MSFGNSLVIALGVTVVALLIAALLWWLNRTPAGYRHAADEELPLYSVSLNRSSAPAPRATPPSSAMVSAAPRVPTAAPASPTPAVPRAGTSGSGTAASGVATRPSLVTPEPTPSPMPSAAPSSPPAPPLADPPLADPPLAAPRAITAHGVPGTEIEGHLLRFSVPQEGTLQFLPGRLEITSGADAGREVRFVRVPGPDGTTVTFGRSEGPAYRHIQLREATVSRQHARLRLEQAQWHLTNLSATNPVVYNGRQLRDGEEQPLSDGDRIEMGEVVFGFRSR